jgi:hypothetical protein
VSHGCVRVERPYDLALFVMGERGSKVAERIGYSIRADVSALGKPRDQLTDQQLEVLDTSGATCSSQRDRWNPPCRCTSSLLRSTRQRR